MNDDLKDDEGSLVDKYPFLIRHLSNKEGGGFLIEFPDLPGCMSDGDTIEEAIANGRDAALCWLETAKEAGWVIPAPETQSGKWVQRVPKSLHNTLVLQAKNEGVSLNTLVVSMIAEGLGKRYYNIPKEKLTHRTSPVSKRLGIRLGTLMSSRKTAAKGVSRKAGATSSKMKAKKGKKVVDTTPQSSRPNQSKRRVRH